MKGEGKHLRTVLNIRSRGCLVQFKLQMKNNESFRTITFSAIVKTKHTQMSFIVYLKFKLLGIPYRGLQSSVPAQAGMVLQERTRHFCEASS